MINLETLVSFVNARLNRILTVAEASLAPGQFKAFRKFALDEFGTKGLVGDLRRSLGKGSQEPGMEWHGPDEKRQ